MEIQRSVYQYWQGYVLVFPFTALSLYRALSVVIIVIVANRKLQLARFEWTQISLDTLDEDVGLLLNKLKACLEDIDGVKEEDKEEYKDGSYC